MVVHNYFHRRWEIPNILYCLNIWTVYIHSCWQFLFIKLLCIDIFYIISLIVMFTNKRDACPYWGKELKRKNKGKRRKEFDHWAIFLLASIRLLILNFLSFPLGVVITHPCNSLSYRFRTYLWFDEKGKKTRVAAPQYIDYVMTFTQRTVSDETIFPTKYGKFIVSPFAVK